MPHFDFIVIPNMKRKGFSTDLKRGRVYAKGDPKSFSDIELSSIYINYEPLPYAYLIQIEEYNKRITEENRNKDKDNQQELLNIGRASDFPDEINIKYNSDVNYFFQGGFKSEERLEKEGKLNYITLTANPNWSRKWRNSDPDYQKKLSDFMVQNDVAIFGKKKNKKKKKKKNKKK